MMMEERNMARTKTIASIDSEIARAQDALVKAKAKYDVIAKSGRAHGKEKRASSESNNGSFHQEW